MTLGPLGIIQQIVSLYTSNKLLSLASDSYSARFGADCVHFPGVPLLDFDLHWAICLSCGTHARR